MMKGAVIVVFLAVIGCQSSPAPAVAVEHESPERKAAVLLDDHLSSAAYRHQVDSLHALVMLDTSAQWEELSHVPQQRSMPSKKGVGSGPNQPALSLKRIEDLWMIRWIDDALIDRCLLVCEGRAVFLQEHCFNDQWSRCGVGFSRTTYWRADSIVDREFRAVWTTDSLEWHNDPCNCLSETAPLIPDSILQQLPEATRIQIVREP